MWFALVALCSACQKSEAPADAAQGAPVTPPADPGGAGRPDGVTLTECPKSLGGEETRVHRVIARECGAVLVAETYRLDDGSLTLEPGASLQFKDGAGLIVGERADARLILKGTADAPVVLTSAGDRSPGAWLGVELHARAAGSSLEHAVIEYGGDASRALFVAAPEVRVERTTIRHAPGVGVRVGEGGGFAAFAGNTLHKLGDPLAIALPPAAVAGLGADNRFDGRAAIHVLAGTLDRSAAWPAAGVPYVLTGPLALAGAAGATLELSPGTELRLGAEARVVIGGAAPGGLKAVGSAAAPITFTAHERREPGAWSGLRVEAQGELALQHAVVEFGGREEGTGAIAATGGAVSVQHTTFRSDRAGLTLAGDARLSAFADNTFAATPLAVALPPALVAALGEGNAFDRDARIVVEAGTLTSPTTWAAQGAPLELAGTLAVEGGALTLEAGLHLLARPGAAIEVGAAEPATLLVRGSADAPVTIGPVQGPVPLWPGIKLRARSSGNALEHLVLSATSPGPGVWVDAGVDASLRDVTCARCSSAVVAWACGAKLSRSAVLAAEGTPAVEAPPSGC